MLYIVHIQLLAKDTKARNNACQQLCFKLMRWLNAFLWAAGPCRAGVHDHPAYPVSRTFRGDGFGRGIRCVAVWATRLRENARRESRRGRLRRQLHLDQGPRAVEQVRRRERASCATALHARSCCTPVCVVLRRDGRARAATRLRQQPLVRTVCASYAVILFSY